MRADKTIGGKREQAVHCMAGISNASHDGTKRTILPARYAPRPR
jgi:hypothetical protein